MYASCQPTDSTSLALGAGGVRRQTLFVHAWHEFREWIVFPDDGLAGRLGIDIPSR